VSALPTPGMGAALRAGIVYFVIVIAAGFVLGTIRTLVITPWLGPLGAVLVELPPMLAIAWWVCAWLIERFAVGEGLATRLLMGVVAFILLLMAELVLSLALFGGTVAGFAAAFGTPEGAVGLAGQVAFAAMPLLVRRGSSSMAR
jgi:hypothetical protein